MNSEYQTSHPDPHKKQSRISANNYVISDQLASQKPADIWIYTVFKTGTYPDSTPVLTIEL